MMKLLQRIRILISALCFLIFNRVCSVLFPLKEHRVCFLAETHVGLNGNLLAVYEYLSAEGSWELVAHTSGDKRESISIARTLQIWKDISLSKYIFLDDMYTITSYMKVRHGQELVQLWHGAGAYKKFGYSREDLQRKTGGSLRIHGGYRKYTKAIVSGSRIAWCYAEAFGMEPEKVHATGIPRMDSLFDSQHIADRRAAFFNEYPFLKGRKLLLFAPTYRGTLVEKADYDFRQANLDELVRRLGDTYVVLTRWHPALKNNIGRGLTKTENCTFGKQIFDVTEYGDINDLLIACDLLITDYSSVIFDYFPLQKPVVYFAYDKADYVGGRGLYYDFEDYVYGRVAESSEELARAIVDADLCEAKREAFHDLFLDSCDGESTGRVCELIFGKM